MDDFDKMFHEAAESVVEFKIEDGGLEKEFLELKNLSEESRAEARKLNSIVQEGVARVRLAQAKHHAKAQELNRKVLEKYPDKHKMLGDQFKVDYREDGVYFTPVTEEEKRERIKAGVKANAEATKEGLAYAYQENVADESHQITVDEDKPIPEEYQEIIHEILILGGDKDIEYGNFDLNTLENIRDSLKESQEKNKKEDS